MEFSYRARDRSGGLREGRLSAADRAAALDRLRQMDLMVVALNEAQTGRFSLDTEISLGGSGRVSDRDLANFCAQLSSLLEAGVPVLQSLSVLSRQFERKLLGRVLNAVIASIEAGNSLSHALKEQEQFLPQSLIYITTVAEASGSLDASYALLARHYEQEDNFAGKIKSALTYPAVVLTVALGVILFMVTVVLPTYGQLFSQMGADLPPSTRTLMAFGGAVQRYWYLVPVALFLPVWLVRLLFRRREVLSAWQRLLLRLPVVGSIVHKREMSSLCRTLGTMVRAGVPLLSALMTVRESIRNAPLQEALTAVQEEVRRGQTFGQALQRQPIFDRASVEIISLGESAGKLDTMLFRVAELTEKDVDRLLDQFTKLLEPMLTVLLGGIVVSIILPMILPMFEIIGKVR